MRNFVLHEKLFLYNLLSQSHRIKYLTIDFPFMSLCVPIVVIYSHRNSIILRTNTALYGYLHFSTLAWKIPWTEEPGRLQSMGSQRVGYDWATSLSLFTFLHWRRKWQPTPVFLPGESQEWGSLVGCRLWGCTELDTTEGT